MSPRRCLTLALATACLAVGASPAAAEAAPCKYAGYRITANADVSCRDAKAILAPWVNFGAYDGGISGTGGSLAGQWNCWRPTKRKAGRCSTT